MKIEDSSQKMAVMHQLNTRAEKPDATGAQAQSESVVKPQAASDKVELSGMSGMSGTMPMSQDMMSQQALREQRVQEIKAQVQAGTYQVDSREVAQKMLSKVAAGTTVH